MFSKDKTFKSCQNEQFNKTKVLIFLFLYLK